jgi:hypothetical protein
MFGSSGTPLLENHCDAHLQGAEAFMVIELTIFSAWPALECDLLSLRGA